MRVGVGVGVGVGAGALRTSVGPSPYDVAVFLVAKLHPIGWRRGGRTVGTSGAREDRQAAC